MASFAVPAIGAGISAIGSLLGLGSQKEAIKAASAAQSNAATNNASLDAAATDKANQYTEDNLNATVADNSPYQAAGSKALSQLSAGTADGGVFNSTPTSQQVMAQDPGYQFTLDQGQEALQRAEAAGGGVGSGGALKAGAQYASDLATTHYGAALTNFMNNRQANYSNLSNLANFGQTANSTDAAARTSADSTVAGTTLSGTQAQTGALGDAANATAGGYIGAANATTAALSGIGSAAQQAAAQMSSGYHPSGSVADLAPNQVPYN